MQLDRIAVAFVPFEAQQYDRDAAIDVLRRAQTRLQGRPDVVTSAFGSFLPLPLPWNPFPQTAVIVGPDSTTVAVDSADAIDARVVGVSRDFFSLFAFDSQEGALPSSSDIDQSRGWVVITRSVKTKLFGDREAIGRYIYWRYSRFGRAVNNVGAARVVSVVQDVTSNGAVGSDLLFVSPFDTSLPAATVAVRLKPGTLWPSTQLLAELRAVDPRMAVAISGMADRLAGTRVIVSLFVTRVAALLALAATILSAGGVFGTTSYFVRLRQREIAIRLVLGASPRQAAAHVLKRTLGPIGQGVAIGGAAAFAARVAAVAWLGPETPNVRLSNVVLSGLVVSAVGLIAAIYPTSRAVSVNPSAVLRDL
jgi:ABC-type antimicrobial peptide transport system permease subunit